MRLIAVLAQVVLLLIVLVVGCGGETSPTSTPSPTPVPTATPSLTPTLTPTPTSSAVAVAWVARYKGPAGGADWAFAIAVDGLGNVYVTGKSFSRLNYDYSYATVKYDRDGKELWVARYDGPGGDDDVAQAIAVDGLGNVCVTGKSYTGNHTNYAYATVKYDTNGTQLWAARYDDPGGGDDVARAIAVDGLGNVYVTGSSGGNYTTIKYDGQGNQLWVARYDGAPGSNDGAVAIDVDGSGNVYVTGSSGGDYATVKYDNEGNQLWIARYKGEASAMALDNSGNVYVTGQSRGGYATLKYDSEGKQLWVSGCYGLKCSDGKAAAIDVDGSGNVYVTGQSRSSRTFTYGYVTVKYDNNGKQKWIAEYDVPEGEDSGAVAIAVDSLGKVYVTGKRYNGSDFDYAYTTIKYDSAGNELWAERYDGPAGGIDQPAAIAVDQWGNVYVTGKSDGGRTCADYVTIKYVSRD